MNRWHSLTRRVHDYFFPHERNAYRPHVFSKTSLGVIVAGLLALQVVYVFETQYLFRKTDFLAAVLPGALTALTNESRESQSLPPVTHDPKLAQAAQLAVNDMAARGYFAHESPDGKTPWYWLRQVGYVYRHAGQNLAVNFEDSEEVQQGWLNSPTHRANIMKREYTRVGIAVAKGTYKGKEAIFVVQYFATPPAPPATPASPVATSQPAPVAPGPTPSPAPSVTADERATETQLVQANPQTPTEAGSASEPAATASEEGTSSPTSTEAAVLGAQDPPVITVAAATEAPIIAKILTSPRSSMLAVLIVLTAITIVLLAFAIGTHLRHQYIEVIAGGLGLLLILLALTVFQILSVKEQTIPEGPGSMVETASTTDR